MADGRKNNGGNSTKATRPDDKRLNPFKDVVRKACKPHQVKEVLEMLYSQAVYKHSTRAAKIYLEYCLGKPKETKDVNLNVEQPFFPDV